MGRRIRWLGVIMVACLGLVIAQLVNIQLVKAKSLQTSPYNPRIEVQRFINPRGEILASDGTVLAKSVPTPAGTNRIDYPYHFVRQYPQGPLYGGITGYDSALSGATTDIENYYDSYLGAHQQAPSTLSQILFREKLPTTTDNVTLTINPALQQAAWNALTSAPGTYNGGPANDGAVVVIQPKTGNILAMVSNPTYDPNALVSTSLAANNLAYVSYTTKDHEGFYPLRPLAQSETFFPGSTMKVVTSTAAYNLKPSLAGFDFPTAQCVKFADSNVPLCDQSGPCGGTMVQMLPFSCDPGYAELGVQVGVSTLRQQAELFGINAVPPIDLPAVGHQPTAGVVPSTLTTLPENAQAFQGFAAIGQKEIADTALQNAMVAAGVANGGVLMTPHLMSSIRDSTGALVTTYQDKPMSHPASSAAAQAVTALMESVTQPGGTAAGVGFPGYLCAAVKTGTAQTGLSVNHDWMIGFAPANNPQIAVAVVVPFQNISSDGAGIAGPIVNKIMQAALPPGSVQQPCNVQMPPASAFGH